MKLRKRFIQCEICPTNFGEEQDPRTKQKRNEHLKETGHNMFGIYETFLFHRFGFKTEEIRMYGD